MNINFKISAIANTYNPLFELTSEELSEKNMVKMLVDANPGFPCRVSLEDAEIGEKVLLLPLEYHKTTSPYKASGPVFIRKNAVKVDLAVNEIPAMLYKRQQTLRVYNTNGMMIAAKSPSADALRNEIETLLKNPKASYIQVHNTNPGCYNCQINRIV
ncbi:MAG: DUF1203 domain-containing protein [Flavobacteriaceae bacterium]|nr:DUF1203 domain-containing protein [Flavobacteriaceae bacterium]